MLNPLLSVIRRRDIPKRFKVLTAATHEGWQNMLGNVNADFYMISGEGMKQWDYHTRAMPANHFMYNLPFNQMRLDIPFDLILCQNRLSQYGIFQHISQRYHIPMIVLDHTEPPPGVSKVQMDEIMSWRGDKHVFITEHNKRTWNGKAEDVVIPHGIDIELFKGWEGTEDKGISIVNHFAQRDVFCGWNLWSQLASKLRIELVGENPGRSKSINDPKVMVQHINNAKYFLNTSQLSPCPLSLLEAASCGIPVVSTANQEVPKIFTHGVDALLSNKPEELLEYCQLMLTNKELAQKIGAAGRQTIIDKFGINKFVERWDSILRETYEEAR